MKKEKSAEKKRFRKNQLSASWRYFAPCMEFFEMQKNLVLLPSVKAPLKVTKAFFSESGLEPIWSENRLLELVGDILLEAFDGLGPVYGKAGQIFLSRLNGKWKQAAESIQLDRLYGKWPELSFSEIERILDEQMPIWRDHLDIEPKALGVASMAQVHFATDLKKRKWVVKIIKPQAKKRLEETLAAISQLLRLAGPWMKMSSAGRRTLKEVEELIASLKEETNLSLEKMNIDRMRHRIAKKKQTILRIPQTHSELCSANVLVVECFEGHSLADVVGGKVQLKSDVRRKLARKVLHELLVQVFELGIFHGDPHAGNLILLDDGTVGLFDWGLTGELLDSDRRHISSLLKAVMAMDMERLTDTLEQMGLEHGVTVKRERIEKEIAKVSRMIKHHKDQGRKPTLQELLEACLKSAESLNIPVPDGLLMMAKSLLTIEGLARGIDPEIAMARIATPVLFKAAKPGFKDIIAM